MRAVLDLDATVPAVVLRIGGTSAHHGSLGIIRTLGRLGVPVYTVCSRRYTPAAASRYLAGTFHWKSRHTGTETLSKYLLRIAKRFPSRPILIATNDMTATFVAKHLEAFRQAYLLPQVAQELPGRLSDKSELYTLCRKIGAPCPASVVWRSESDLRSFLEHRTFPVVIKEAESRQPSGRSISTTIVHTSEQLRALCARMANPERPNLLLQEYIPLECSEDWIFHSYRNAKTDRFLGFTGKKLRSYPPFAGITTLGISVPNEQLSRQAHALLKSIDYNGIADLDYRFDKRDGEYKLLDFNPRVGANFRMFENQAGVDVVRALHLDLTGRDFPDAPPKEGRVFIVESYDLLASIGYFRRGGLTLRDWRNSFRGDAELAWLQPDDPLPFAGMCSHLAMAAMRRVLRAGAGTLRLKSRGRNEGRTRKPSPANRPLRPEERTSL